MAGSLREALVKAGLVSPEQAAAIERAQREAREQVPVAPMVIASPPTPRPTSTDVAPSATIIPMIRLVRGRKDGPAN